MFGGAMPITTTVQSAAPSDTSACVRIPAGLPRTSRSIPIPLPMSAAANKRSTSSEVSGGRYVMHGDCRSQAGRAAGGVPEREELDAVALDAVIEVVTNGVERQSANELAVAQVTSGAGGGIRS